jgi:SAM-dependent methyltransferase
VSASPTPDTLIRTSHGLEQFFSVLAERSRLEVLDLGEFTQANVEFITGLGHRLTFEDVLRTADAIFGPGDPATTQSSPEACQRFLDQVLQYAPMRFDAILVWDVFEHLTRPLMLEVLARLHRLLRPQGLMLACFHAEGPGDVVDTFSFRIAGARTLLLKPRGARKVAQAFNNRAIERLFEQFQSVKFFLTRDYLREVIVRR